MKSGVREREKENEKFKLKRESEKEKRYLVPLKLKRAPVEKLRQVSIIWTQLYCRQTTLLRTETKRRVFHISLIYFNFAFVMHNFRLAEVFKSNVPFMEREPSLMILRRNLI